MKRIWLIGLAVLTMLLPGYTSSVGAKALAQPSGAQRDVTYCTASGVALKMDIYPPSGGQGKPAPVVLYIHGGSWISGDKWEIGLAAGDLTAMGYLVASINYRLAPQYKWPSQIEDVKCAVRYLRANASTYNLDPNRIAAWGSSAGGHLAALLGLTNKSAGFEGNGGYPEQSSSVQAVIEMFGPTDLTAFNPDEFATGIGESVFGVKPGDPTDILVRASPVNYVTASAPPFLILQGDKDRVVPPDQSQKLHNKLVAVGAQSRLVMVKNADHGFSPVGGAISPSLIEIRSIIHDFLDRNIGATQAEPQARVFNETGKTVQGKFLRYWETHGGLAQQGFPISGEIQERSETDGKTYTVQYFERAVFEMHPENQPPYDVLLSLLGRLQYKKQWPGPYYPLQQASTNNPRLFQETGKTIGGAFRQYWEANGGLAQQGYPITNEFQERSLLDGNLYTVQYFERAVFELHPENQPPYNVLLSHLGKFRYDARYNSGVSPTPTPKTDQRDCLDVIRLKGTIIAQGTNTVPTAHASLKTYQVEEVRLQSAVTCTVLFPDPANNRLVPRDFAVDKYWRLSILADNAVSGQGEIPLGMWLDGTLVGHTVGSGDRYATNIYDLTYLREGATISIGSVVRGPQYYLPEQLQFNKSP